jgi:thiol-disulfide isomerase/thioredoxin
VTLYKKLGALMQESGDPAFAAQAEKIAGAARRLDLIGNEMKITGTTADGQPFDLESLRDSKAILVDYWATWCGPCRAEHPNVQALYDKYHDQGFNVVGISGDNDLEPLQKYITEHDVPWVNLFHDGEGEMPAMSSYGISAFPTMILIGPDFKVVSLHARGPKLEQLLSEIFPESEVSEDNDAESAEAESSDDAADEGSDEPADTAEPATDE